MTNMQAIYLNTIKEITGKQYQNVNDCPNILCEFEKYDCRHFTYSYDDGHQKHYIKFRMDMSFLIDRQVEIFDLMSNYGLQKLELQTYTDSQRINRKVLLNKALLEKAAVSSNQAPQRQKSKSEIEKFNSILNKAQSSRIKVSVKQDVADQ